MSFHQVLTTLKTLILNPIELPSDEAERALLLAQKFPDLLPEEISDFSKIDPLKLKTYTNSIFSSQRGFFRRRMPLTYKILTQEWEKSTGKEFNGFEFAMLRHSKKPWHSNRLPDLADAFKNFLIEDCSELTKVAPMIVDTATFEAESIKIFRAKDEFPSPKDSLTPELISSLSIESLMACTITVPQLVSKLTLKYDPLILQGEFEAGTLSGNILPQVTHLLGGRNKNHDVRWVKVPACFLEIGRCKTVEDLANLFLSSGEVQSEPNKTEDKIFLDFLSLLVELNNAGIIIITSPS